MVKRLWGFNKMRYRGLAKNATRAFVTLAMANTSLERGTLLQQVRASASQERAKARDQGKNESNVPKMRPKFE